MQNLQDLLNAQKAECLIIKEERDELKATYLEEIDKLKEDIERKNKNIDNLRTDLMQTKDERMRFETSLRNKDAELARLQMQLDKVLFILKFFRILIQNFRSPLT